MRATPPGPKGEAVFGNSRQYADDPFEFVTVCAETYGDVVHFDLGPLETYMVTDPEEIGRILVDDDAKYAKPNFQDEALGDLLGDGLLLSEGETWRRQRELANPAFDPRRLQGMVDTMGDYTEALLAGWRDGEVRDVQVDMTEVTLRIICEAMLGVGLDDDRIETVRESLEPLGARFEPDPLRFLLPDWVPTRENREYEAALDTMEAMIDDIVAERRGTHGPGADDPPSDLLSILLRAQERGAQTDEQIRDEVMTILLAGHDTTALTLTYAWYLLSQHPEAAATLRAEADEVLSDGRAPTAAQVRELDYTEHVLKESMRLYPPVYVMFREPKVDVRIGDYRVPEGAAVMLPQWVVHRSADHWEDPETFDPDRWTPERARGRERFAYFPFGGGPRHCIGKHLSLLEGRIITATVAANYDLEYARDEPFDLRGSLTMHPQQPMSMRVRER